MTVKSLALALTALGTAVAVCAPGCAPPGTYSKVRSAIRDAVRKQLGPADRYDVSTSRDSVDRLLRGELRRVDIHGVNVSPAPGYFLDEVFMAIRNVRFDRKAGKVESADETLITGYVGDSALERMLAGYLPISEAKVHIGRDTVEVQGKYALGGAVPVPVTAVGKVRLAGPTTVEFATESVKAGPLPIPMSMSKAFDFGRIYEPLVLTGVTTEPGRAVLTGTIDWSKVRE